ncbi:MAG: hypothetical protein BWY86_01123 [Candidatus Aminicenantes bacterium ADurb.Bin508]|nr:MAG: hypothetical protein BWY86_01123 [Candidatus Aminicenantes bacterium ADurb.Bin508]
MSSTERGLESKLLPAMNWRSWVVRKLMVRERRKKWRERKRKVEPTRGRVGRRGWLRERVRRSEKRVKGRATAEKLPRERRGFTPENPGPWAFP